MTSRAPLLALWLVACGKADVPAGGDSAAPSTATPEVLPDALWEPGPHGVGYRTFDMTWSEDGLAADRPLRVALWYPSPSTDEPDTTYQGLFPAPGVQEGVPLADGTFPLAVYSHGHQGYAEASGRLMAHLASHGWVVAAPDHTGNTTFDGSDRPTSIYWQRPRDLSHVLDHLLDGQDAALAGRVNAPVLAMGHSFGGYTVHALAGAEYAMDDVAPGCLDGSDTTAFCSTFDADAEAIFRAGLYDERIAAVASMAPGDHRLFGSGLSATVPPILHLTGELDPTGNGDELWAAFDGPDDRRVHFPGGGHQTFTDFSGVLEDFDGLIPPEEADPILFAYTLAFARLHVLGDESVRPVVDGTMPVSDQITWSRPEGQ